MTAFSGTLLVNNVAVGVYKTKTPEACLYIVSHREAEGIVCEDRKLLAMYEGVMSQLKQIKAFVLG